MAHFGFIPVSLSTLYPAEDLGLDLYVRPQGFQRPVLFCPGERSPERAELGRLEESGITKLYIRREARRAYHDFLRGRLHVWLADASLLLATRAGALSEVIRDVLSGSLQSRDPLELIEQTGKLGELVATLLSREPLSFSELRRVLHHDWAPFTHAANVCYYAVLLARDAGVSAAELPRIAAAALLHDVGHDEIDDRILTRDGRLAEVDSRQLREHPVSAFRKLCRLRQWSAPQLLMVYQHHEHLDGGGYPVGSLGCEIHLWARICSIVDAFESLTSRRPHRKPLSPEAALEVLGRDSGTLFDPELLARFNGLVQVPSGAR